MNCPNCNSVNAEGSLYCVNCGTKLTPNTQVTQTIQNTQVAQNVQNTPQPNHNESKKTFNFNLKEYISIILSFLLKPFSTLGEHISKFSDFTYSLVMMLMVSVVGGILSLLKAMVNAVVVTSIFTNKTSLVWENLKNVKYFSTLIGGIFGYAVIILFIAVIYYFACLIVKKEVSFPKFLGISSLTIIPLILTSLVLSPIFGMIYMHLGVLCSIAGVMYTLVLMYESYNSEMKLDGNVKYYVNTGVLIVLLFAAYLVVYSTVSNAFNTLL